MSICVMAEVRGKRAQATGYAGNQDVRTPHLDRLAGESIKLANAASCCPVCCPYRASFLTGQYPLTHGVFLNDVLLRSEAVSIAEVYQRAAYKTADSGKVVGAIPDTPGVHGIAIASEFKHGFTSNGREDKVSMFDPSSLNLIKKINVGKGPDGIYYHPGTKRVFTNNRGSHDITAINAATGEVVGTVKADGDGEEAVIGDDGLIYVNSEDTAEVVVFDPKSLEVKKRFPIGVAKTPTGLAYDPKTNRLFIGCREEPKMVVMDAATGKVINSFPIGANVDYADFDPSSRLIFFSCGDGTLSIYHEKSADDYQDAGAVKTQPSAKTMAFDPQTKKIFLSAAEYQETPAADPSKRPRRSVKPGSFVVLVVGKP